MNIQKALQHAKGGSKVSLPFWTNGKHMTYDHKLNRLKIHHNDNKEGFVILDMPSECVLSTEWEVI